MLHALAAMHLTVMADSSSAGSIMRSYVSPVVRTMCVLASLVCAFFLVNGGISYMTSAGKPEQLEHAKSVLKNALIGLVIVLAAGVLAAVLSHAYSSSGASVAQKLPSLTEIPPTPVSNGLVDILIKAVTGLLNNIIQAVAAPFLAALSFFTSSTPLMADNSSVFNLWLAIVGIADALFMLVVALLGFHVMSFSTFGLDEIEFKHLLPRLTAIFLLMNTSLFVIDGIIELSNAMIHAVHAGLKAGSVWEVLSAIVKQSGGLGVAALLIMIVFVILAVILLVYYVGRIVTLYIGAVLAPIVLLVWLIPGFRDFSETATKTYITTIFVLFVHVIILQLAASLFAGMVISSPSHTPDTLMAMVVGLATVVALLKTQGVMMQLSYASIGPRTARKLGGQFMTGVSYISGKGKAATEVVSGKHKKKEDQKHSKIISVMGMDSNGNNAAINFRVAEPKQPKKKRTTTGTTTVAPKLDTTPKEEAKS